MGGITDSVERFTKLEASIKDAETRLAILDNKLADLTSELDRLLTESGCQSEEELANKISEWNDKIDGALRQIESDAKSLGFAV